MYADTQNQNAQPWPIENESKDLIQGCLCGPI